MPKPSKKKTKETANQGVHTGSTTGEKSLTASESNPMGQWIRDLEMIFEKAMQEEKLNIALKAKELLARNKGWISGGVASTPLSIKSIDQWTLQEINALISQLDAYGDAGDSNEGNSGGDPDGAWGTGPWRTTESAPDPKDPREGQGTQPLDSEEDPTP
jgi:hypothetical protein